MLSNRLRNEAFESSKCQGTKGSDASSTQDSLGNLRTYYTAFHPKDFLFEGQKGAGYSVKAFNSSPRSTLIEPKYIKQSHPIYCDP